MAIPIIPILKYIAVQVLVPIAIEKAPVLIDKIGKKIKEKKALRKARPPLHKTNTISPQTHTTRKNTPWKSQNH